MSQAREPFATQVNAELLSAVRELAQQEGRPLQTLVEEALADLIEKRRSGGPRDRVMRAYLDSHEKDGELYQKLAK